MLGQHAQVTHEGNALSQDRLDLGQYLPPALGLHVFRTRLNQASGIAHRLGGRFVGLVG